MNTPIISVKDVHKSYGRGQNRFDALKGVSFDIREGESIAIVGKSGSGKSTLMHVLALLDAPTSGTVELEGVDTATLRGGRLNRTRNKTFGFVFQQFFLTGNYVGARERDPAAEDRGRRPRRSASGAVSPRSQQLELDDKAKNKARQPLRRPEAAHRHRARPREQPADHLRRRADRQPRHRTPAPSWRTSCSRSTARAASP